MVQNKNQQKPPPMFAKGQIIEIFFKLDEFWKNFSHFSPKCIILQVIEVFPHIAFCKGIP